MPRRRPDQRAAPGIGPRVIDWKAYDRALRRDILEPLVVQIEESVQQAGRSYRLIAEAMQYLREARNLAGGSYGEVRMYFDGIERWHRQRFRALMRRHLGIRVDQITAESVRPLLQQIVERNVSLIRTIPPRLHKSLADDLLKLHETAPFDQQRLRKLLQKNYGSSKYNLRRLTRDQTQKTIGKLSEARQITVGVKEYEWSTSADERVRPTHVDNGGLVFRWDNPPSGTGHPGNDVQCRCVALAIIP